MSLPTKKRRRSRIATADMGGDITLPDAPVVYPTLADLLAGLPPETIVYFTIARPAFTPQIERVAILGKGILPPQPQVERMQVASSNGANVRDKPSLSGTKIGHGLPAGSEIEIVGSIAADQYHWGMITSGSFQGGFVARELLKKL
jgi:hypothetical protein